eukprot:5463184-Prorocentrum_lima.AAC.1
MTSSLVGSEMCIRDRAIPGAPPQRFLREGGVAARARPSHGSSASSGPRRPSPVSYTHLTLPTICSV